MFRKLGRKWPVGLVCLGFGCVTPSKSHTIEPALADPPANVILIIGDGMDDQQITIARNYLRGNKGRLSLDNMALRSTVQVLTVDEGFPDKARYVADSGSSGTALATGTVTSRGRIATTAKFDQDVVSITELAQQAGLSTGVVTTASVTDATPASFMTHVSSRHCQNPQKLFICQHDSKENQGMGSIAEQIADSAMDLVFGGGAQHFAAVIADSQQSVRERAVANHFQLMDNITKMVSVPKGQKVLGLFSDNTMPVKLIGKNQRVAEKLQPSFLHRVSRYLGSVEFPKPIVCQDNPTFVGVPTLKQMTDAALLHLGSGDKGFFLMVESGSIDKQSHLRNVCGQIGEVEQLEGALQSALAFSQKHPRTLILVTADHGQAAQIIPDRDKRVKKYTPGFLARLKTPEGSIMAVNYGTSQSGDEEHSGVDVPLFVNQQGIGRVASMVTQPQIFDLMVDYLQLQK